MLLRRLRNLQAALLFYLLKNFYSLTHSKKKVCLNKQTFFIRKQSKNVGFCDIIYSSNAHLDESREMLR